MSAAVDPERQAADAIANATVNSLADNAVGQASWTLQRKARRYLRDRLPRFLHPLIPGEKGSVVKEIRRNIWRWVMGLVFSIVITLLLVGVIGTFLIVIAGMVAWQLMVGG